MDVLKIVRIIMDVFFAYTLFSAYRIQKISWYDDNDRISHRNYQCYDPSRGKKYLFITMTIWLVVGIQIVLMHLMFNHHVMDWYKTVIILFPFCVAGYTALLFFMIYWIGDVPELSAISYLIHHWWSIVLLASSSLLCFVMPGKEEATIMLRELHGFSEKYMYYIEYARIFTITGFIGINRCVSSIGFVHDGEEIDESILRVVTQSLALCSVSISLLPYIVNIQDFAIFFSLGFTIVFIERTCLQKWVSKRELTWWHMQEQLDDRVMINSLVVGVMGHIKDNNDLDRTHQ